jgi:hypothetical protein
MNSLTGAQRPVLKRKILWIAITAIVLVLAWAKAGFPYPAAANPYLLFGTDGTVVEGMMPPNGYMMPNPTPTPQSQPNPQKGLQPMGQPPATAAPIVVKKPSTGFNLATKDVTITQTGGGKSIKYVASPTGTTANGTVYLVKRGGTPWVTVTYNKSTGTWDLTDPNGVGSLLLRLGAKSAAPGSHIESR